MNATVTKIKNAEPAGQYTPTAIDARKAVADIPVLQVGPTVVDSRVSLSGRGIKPMSIAGRYTVTADGPERLSRKYLIATDF